MTKPIYLTTAELAKRWRLRTQTTLRMQRMRGQGPRYTKVGGRVLYALSDVLKHERKGKRG